MDKNPFWPERKGIAGITPKMTLNPRAVRAMKNFQASYNDANYISKQAKQEKAINEDSNFLIDLAWISMVVEDKDNWR